MSIFITGDIHATYDIHKLMQSRFDASNLSKDDYVIICGDFGLVWNGTDQEEYWLRWLQARPFTTLFVDGNHEGFTLLNSYPVQEWNGGRVHRINDSVLHLMRGEVFDIEGTRLFAMGGAASSEYDRKHRKPGISWFAEEVPSEEEREHAETVLEKHGWTVDVVVTHCAPTSAAQAISNATDRLEDHPMDEYTDWLETISGKLDYSSWFCGHYHVDAALGSKKQVLYQHIIKLAESPDEGNAFITYPKAPIEDADCELEID